jgi:hypothetical protein
MVCRGSRLPHSVTLIIFSALLVSFHFFLLNGLLSIGFAGRAFGQESETKRAYSTLDSGNRNGSYFRDQLASKWNQRGRTASQGQSPAALRLRAYQQKLAMRAARERGQRPPLAKNAGSGARVSRLSSTTPSSPTTQSSIWTPLGPAPLASDATGDGEQNYNWVTGRATSVLIDPADSTGNTVLLGGAYGGLWRSTNAGSQSPSPASVIWQSLIDDQPTLAVGAIALQPGNSNVILVGTGETNNSPDSYYGLGILRSADGGSTWTQPPIQSAGSGQSSLSFLGIGFSEIAFSTANPNLAVAATAGDNGLYVGLEEDGNSTARGLYFSTDAGVTWNRVILSDGAVPSSATSVIYNAGAGATGTFFAAIQRHGIYSSTDGQHFARLVAQPTAGLVSANCPSASNAMSCQIYRGEFAVVPGRNEMYAWLIDLQLDQYGNVIPVDEGIWQSITGGASWTQIPDNGITNCGDNALPDNGCGVDQGWYNLALAAIPDGGGTDVYAGAVNLYKCTLAGGTACTQGDWINLTHVYGCNPLAAPAHVHPNQHGIAFTVTSDQTSPGYFAHDGGISRTLDGYSGLNAGTCSGTNQFDSLSQPPSASNPQTLGSMTQFVSISVDPDNADIMLGGTEGNGSPKTSTATENSTWQNALGGDGAFTAINPANTNEWFAANPLAAILKCESGTACDDAGFSFAVVSFDPGSDNLGGDQGAFNTPYILDPQNSAEMLVGTCRVWRISTKGSAPVQLSNDFDTLGTGVCTGDEVNLVNAISAGGPTDADSNSTVVYAVTNGYGPLANIITGIPGGTVWVTTAAGISPMANVTLNVNPNNYAISTVTMDSSDATGNTAYIGIMGFSTPAYPTSHVWQTTNAGASWTDWSGTGTAALPDAPVNALLVDSQAGQIYAGTDVGVFTSSTATAGWTEVGPMPVPGASGFLPNAPVTALQMVDIAGTKTLVASTYGRGVWNYGLVTMPDFSVAVAATPYTTVVNQSVTWNGTLTSLDGYTGTVTLSCTAGAPATCNISPATLAPTQTGAPFTVTLACSAVGTFTFTIQGTDGVLTSATPVETLIVGTDMTWTDTGSTTETVLAGQSATYMFSAIPAGGATFSSTVNFGCENLPALTGCTFSPSSIAAGAGTTPVTVTIATTGPNTAVPPSSSGTGAEAVLRPAPMNKGGGDQNAGNRTRTLPFFALAWVVLIGATVLSGKREVKPRLYIAITASCLSLGLMSEISCGGVSGSGGSGSSPNFSIAMTSTTSPTAVNQIVPWNGTLTASNGYGGTVALSCTSGAPATCAFAPSVVTPTSTGTQFTLQLASATPGTFSFTISGTDGTLTNATPMETLTVTQLGAPPNFAIAVSPTPSLTTVNQNVTWNGTLTALNGYLGGVTLSCTNGAPSTCAFTPPIPVASAAGAPFTVTLGSASPATYTFTVQGTGGTLTNATPSESLTVGTAGTGTVIVSPASATLFADEGGNAWLGALTQKQFAATVNGSSSQSVTWAVTDGNANGTVTQTGLYTSPSAVPNPATITVTATSAAASTPGSALVTVKPATPIGASQITVTATAAGGTPHGDVVTLVVH